MKTIWQHLENILKTSENILRKPENKLKTPWDHLEDVYRTSVNTREPQNLDLSSASKSRQNFSLKISTKLQPQNLDKTSASNVDKTSASNLDQRALDRSAQFQHLGQSVINTFLSINISNTNNIKKYFYWGLNNRVVSQNLQISCMARVTSIKSTKQQSVSEWVSELVEGRSQKIVFLGIIPKSPPPLPLWYI